MVGQTPKDTPFGLDANVAAGLAYLLTLIGGLVMLFGGGTNKFVKWAAAQSITLFVIYFVLMFAVGFLSAIVHVIAMLTYPLYLIYIVAWLYTTITAFQGKEVRLPFIADVTQSIFKSQLA